MPHTATPLFAVSPSPSWNDVTIVESAVASSAQPVLRASHPCSTRHPCPSSIPRAVRRSPRTRRQHPPFSPRAFVTIAMPKSTAILLRAHRRLPLAPRCRPPYRFVQDLDLHAVPALSQLPHRHRILHSRMTCATTLFGSVPISAKLRAEAGGRPNPHRSPTT